MFSYHWFDRKGIFTPCKDIFNLYFVLMINSFNLILYLVLNMILSHWIYFSYLCPIISKWNICMYRCLSKATLWTLFYSILLQGWYLDSNWSKFKIFKKTLFITPYPCLYLFVLLKKKYPTVNLPPLQTRMETRVVFTQKIDQFLSHCVLCLTFLT